MPYRLGQHVKAKREGWYGQVVAFVGHDQYRVRIGGTDRARNLSEDELEALLINNRIVAPRAFPLVNVVRQGGAQTIPNLDYPFSNESGLGSEKPLWEDLRVCNLSPGAFVGVSGSIMDFACKEFGACTQIISADINTLTVKAIDELRSIIVLLEQSNSISKVSYNWKLEAEHKSPVTKSGFMIELIDAFRNIYLDPQEELDAFEIDPADCGERLKAALLRFAPSMSGKKPFSSWYKDERSIVFLGNMIHMGKFNILCGDLNNKVFQKALEETLTGKISLFNFSNALDYIKNPKDMAQYFADLPHTENAVVVTSSQVEDLTSHLGKFDAPAIHKWAEFVSLLKKEALQAFYGQLLEVL